MNTSTKTTAVDFAYELGNYEMRIAQTRSRIAAERQFAADCLADNSGRLAEKAVMKVATLTEELEHIEVERDSVLALYCEKIGR